MPGKSGAPLRSFRVPNLVWQRFIEATVRAGTNPRTVLREFVLWYADYPGAELPTRPDQDPPATGSDQG